MFYNLIEGENTVLRGLLAEEFTRYIMSQRFPILILRPSIALRYLDDAAVTGRTVEFIRKNQQTMDFFGIYPFFQDENIHFLPKEIVCRFFCEIEGLSRYFYSNAHSSMLKGFIIEVKSRTSTESWAPFQFSFSPNQRQMLNQSQMFNLDIILCGVTFLPDWNLSVVFCDNNQKRLPDNFFTRDKCGQDEN